MKPAALTIRSKVPLEIRNFSAGGVGLCAQSAVEVHVRSEGEFVFADNESLRIFACGNTMEDAMKQFQEHVVYFYESYAALRDDQVIGEGARLKKLFASSFQMC